MYLLKRVQPLIDQHRKLIKVTPPELLNGDWLLELLDVDPQSNFHFNVKLAREKEKYVVRRTPINGSGVDMYEDVYDLDAMVQRLSQWLDLLEEYDTIPDIFDDPILRSYQAEFAEYFTVQDEDAEEAPLDLPRQLYLSEYLEQMEEKLAERAETASPVQREQLLLIEQECASLRESMGEMTKSQTAKKLASIMAKARKFSIGLVKEFFTEFKKEAYKQIAKGIIEIDLPSMGDVLGSIGPGIQ